MLATDPAHNVIVCTLLTLNIIKVTKSKEMCRADISHERDEKCTRALLETLKARDHLEDGDLDGRSNIKMNIREIYDVA
jgi:hypothetical protein